MNKTANLQTFKRWVIRYRNFAIALPIVLVLTSFFIVENIKDFSGLDGKEKEGANGLNLELPGERPKLDSKGNGKLILEANTSDQKDVSPLPPDPSLGDAQQREKDSLSEIVKQLEALSFDGPKDVTGSVGPPLPREVMEREQGEPLSQEEQRRKMVEERLAYREMLKEGRDKIAGSRGNPHLRDDKKAISSSGDVVYRAAVYRDQFILPDDNVELILLEDMVIDGKLFKRNTFIYALASIEGNRVLLDIDNINHIPVDITVKDHRDGREGLYSQRAGELWREFRADMENSALSGAVDGVTRDSGRILRDMVREVGSFLKNKKLKERDKILLVNDHEVLLLLK